MAEQQAVPPLTSEFVTHDVKRFVLSRAPGFFFRPGQSVELAINRLNWQEERQAFTPTSFVDSGVIESIIKCDPMREGVTRELHSLSPGVGLWMSDPFGTIRYQGPGFFWLVVEAFIYTGQTDFGLQGLLNAKGNNTVKGGDWSNLDNVLNDILAAITVLDNAGFHGPCALALPAERYNNLFHHYEHTDLLQIEHLKSLSTHGVYKAMVGKPAVIDKHAGALVLGQDLRVGYAGCDGIHYRLFVCESLVLRLDEPQAVCVVTE